jgi:hypothetical protein
MPRFQSHVSGDESVGTALTNDVKVPRHVPPHPEGVCVCVLMDSQMCSYVYLYTDTLLVSNTAQ